jgi:ABC-type bacteriocin/lantibiotic exporter with double-glycine peptidase domain
MKNTIERLLRLSGVSVDWDAFNRMIIVNNESLLTELNHLFNDAFFDAHFERRKVQSMADLPDAFVILADEPVLIRRFGFDFIGPDNRALKAEDLLGVEVLLIDLIPKRMSSKIFIEQLVMLFPRANFLLLLVIPFVLIPAFYANLFNTRMIFNDSVYTLIFITIVFTGLWAIDYGARLVIKNLTLNTYDKNSLLVEKYLFSLTPFFKTTNLVSKIRMIETGKKTIWDSMSGILSDFSTFMIIMIIIFVLLGEYALLLLLFYGLVAFAAVYMRYKGYKLYIESEASQQDVLTERIAYYGNKQLPFYNGRLMGRHFLDVFSRAFKTDHGIAKLNFEWDEFVRYSGFVASFVLFTTIFFSAKNDATIFNVLIALLILNGRASSSIVALVSKAFHLVVAAYHIDLSTKELFEKIDDRVFVRGIQLSTVERIDVKSLDVLIEGRKLIEKANMTLESGKIYGFFGNIGTGKSLLLKSIVQAHREFEGVISYNGFYNAKDVDVSFFSNKVGYVDPTTEFVKGSIYYNFDVRGIRDKEQVVRLTKMVFPNVSVDYDFLFQKDILQIPMSTGQRRKLLMLMTINDSRSLVILDEAFINLSMLDVAEFFNYIKQNFKSCIVLVVSHDRGVLNLIPDVYELADKKLNLVKSSVVKLG